MSPMNSFQRGSAGAQRSKMRLPIALTSLAGAAVLALASSCASAPGSKASAMRTVTPDESVALDAVNRRIAAYNAHDIEAFLSTYDENVRTIVYPERLLGEGRERMRSIFGPQFAKGLGTIAVLGQHVLDGRVVSDEDITIGARNDRNIAIYTIKNGLIAEVRLIEKGR
jgi:hypothetical protein